MIPMMKLIDCKRPRVNHIELVVLVDGAVDSVIPCSSRDCGVVIRQQQQLLAQGAIARPLKSAAKWQVLDEFDHLPQAEHIDRVE